LFIVSTKSGTTVETLSAYSYFMEKVKATKGSRAGENFAAITDPDTPLQTIAREMGFRKVFTNFQDIGGRYSALSYFGMVPAAVIGADAGAILQRAARMVEASKSCVPPADNPGVELGAVMAELALEGRNKLTLFMSPQIQSFGYWIEQLVAESTGKLGAGIVPVESEYAGPPSSYGDDRLFVYTRLAGDENAEMDEKVSALEKAGQPVVRIEMSDKYDLGQEYYRWEIAT
ncbi:MAG TPA: glucose-6-phosphate isomerase, partial [Armatimonadetes bacterium]|nr:glucose-6-phosphate isomerase [Armatimonadota bacterium]